MGKNDNAAQLPSYQHLAPIESFRSRLIYVIQSDQPTPETRSYIHAAYALSGVPLLVPNGSKLVGRSVSGPIKVNPAELDPESRQVWEETLATQNNRVSHALKRLKSKNLYYETASELVSAMCAMDDEDMRIIAQMLTYSAAFAFPSIHLTDEIWKCAIEMTMFICNKPLYMDPDAFWGADIVNHLRVLYPMAITLLASGLSSFTCEYLDHMNRNRLPETLSEIAELREQLEQQEAELSARQKREAELRKALEQAKSETVERSQQLHKALLAKESELRALRKIIQNDGQEDEAEGEDEPAAAPQGVQNEQEISINEEDLLDLPQTGVWFVGGGPALHSMLSEIYPDWKYIEIDNDAFSLPGKACKVAFCWYKYVSHKIYNRVKANIDKSTALCYVSSLNKDKLLREMKEQYTAAMAAKDLE